MRFRKHQPALDIGSHLRRTWRDTKRFQHVTFLEGDGAGTGLH